MTSKHCNHGHTVRGFESVQKTNMTCTVNEGLRVIAELALSEATEKAATAARQNLTYVQLAQAQAEKIVAEIAPAVSTPTVTAKGAAKVSVEKLF